jgi:hypothetical protein
MKPRNIAAALLFTFLPATVSLPAWSQDDPLTIQARARFKEGVDAFDKGKFEEARLAFLQAYTLKKHPAVLLNLAQSSEKSNHHLEAVKYFQQFLREATTATPQQRKDAETGLNEARSKVGHIDVVAPPGTEISLDDQGKVGTTPMDPIDVEPGQHTVKSPTQSATVIAVVGQKVEARLMPSSAAAAPAPVPTPPSPAAQAPEAPAAEQPQADTTVHGKSTNLFSRPKNMTPVYVGLGVGVSGLVVGGLFAWFRSDAQTKADTVAANIAAAATARNIPPTGACNSTAAGASDLASACATLRDNNSKVDTNATIANVSIGVGIAGLAFAGIWYLAAAKRDDVTLPSTTGIAPKKPIFMPYAGPNNGGFSFSGEF